MVERREPWDLLLEAEALVLELGSRELSLWAPLPFPGHNTNGHISAFTGLPQFEKLPP